MALLMHIASISLVAFLRMSKALDYQLRSGRTRLALFMAANGLGQLPME